MAIAAGVSAKAASTGSSALTTGAVTSAASGSTFVIGVIHTDNITSVVDSKSNTYTAIGTELTGIGASRLYYSENATGGASHTFTVNLDASAFVTFFVLEITGGLTSGILDQNTRAEDTTEPYTSGTVTTTQATELLSSFAFSDLSSTGYTAGNSFTELQEHGPIGDSTYKGAMGYRVVEATGSYEGSWTLTTDATTQVWIGTFKSASGVTTTYGNISELFILGMG